jgi:surfeit locus 1 family protein
MLRRMIWPLVFGLLGCAILIGLGTWQVQRLTWKEGILSAMDARLGDAPVALPASPDSVRDRFLPVTATGTITEDGVFVMASQRGLGAGYRLIAAFDMGDRRILIDRGFIPANLRDDPRPEAIGVTITGNLHWPEDANSFTPAPDRAARLWFARDLPDIAATLNTDPVLIVLRNSTESAPPAQFVPLDSAGIANNHLNYAITWFSLAFVWLGMTGFLLWHIRQQNA